LKKELSEYKKHFTQHDDIYIPSYNELTENKSQTVQIIKFVFSQLKVETLKSSKLIIPGFKKRLNEIGIVQIRKRD
jgi:hypothetical protein